VLDRFQGKTYDDRLEKQSGSADCVRWKTVEQGAATSVLLAGSPVSEGITGAYFEDLTESPATELPLAADSTHAGGVASYAMNAERARLLAFRRGTAAWPAAGTAGQDGHAARAAAWTVRRAPRAQLVDMACAAAVYCPA
jgi:hypothetical protein